MINLYFPLTQLCCKFGPEANMCIDSFVADSIPGRLLSISKINENINQQYFEYTKQVVYN